MSLLSASLFCTVHYLIQFEMCRMRLLPWYLPVYLSIYSIYYSFIRWMAVCTTHLTIHGSNENCKLNCTLLMNNWEGKLKMEVQDGRDLHLQFLSRGLFVSDVQLLALESGWPKFQSFGSRNLWTTPLILFILNDRHHQSIEIFL